MPRTSCAPTLQITDAALTNVSECVNANTLSTDTSRTTVSKGAVHRILRSASKSADAAFAVGLPRPNFYHARFTRHLCSLRTILI